VRRFAEMISRVLFRRLQGVGSLLIVGVLAAAAPARAGGSNLALSWSAPASCPTQRDVRQTVSSWLAQSVEPSDTSRIRVAAAVSRESRGFVLDLRLVTASGTHREQLVAARCETLAGVVALKVALAADPGAAYVSRAAPERTVRWGLRLSGSIGSGVLPGLGPMVGLAGALHFGYLALELGAAYGFRAPVRYAALPSVGADLELFEASARLCVVPGLGTVELPICGGFSLGLMRGVGFGLPMTSDAAEPYGALTISPGVRWRLASMVHAMIGFEAWVAVDRPTFHVRNLERLYRPAQIAARAQLGVELRFD
jgi:hypothetical protein